MTTRREYAISLGLAQPGRGRMSREANAACDKAEAEGMVFDAPVVKPSRPNPKVAASGVSATQRAADERARKAQRVVQETPEGPSKAFTGKFEATMPDGKRKALSGRTACTCGASLVYCLCKTPTVGLLIVDPLADETDATVDIARV